MLVVHPARIRRWLALASFLLLLGVSAPAGAISITVDGGWTNFSWVDGTGPIDLPADGYQFTSASSVEVQITDSSLIGDQFEIFVNGVSQGLTSTPVGSGPSGAFSGPVAWADSRLSKISLLLAPGTYDIDITVVSSVVTTTSGGFIQVFVPEPGTLALLALGLAGLLWISSAPQPSARPSAPKR